MREAGPGPRPPWGQERPPTAGLRCHGRRPRGGRRDKRQVSQDMAAAGQQRPAHRAHSGHSGPSTVPEGETHAEGPRCPGGSGHGRPQPQVTSARLCEGTRTVVRATCVCLRTPERPWAGPGLGGRLCSGGTSPGAGRAASPPGAGGSAGACKSCRALGTGCRGRGSRSCPAEPPHPSPGTPRPPTLGWDEAPQAEGTRPAPLVARPDAEGTGATALCAHRCPLLCRTRSRSGPALGASSPATAVSPAPGMRPSPCAGRGLATCVHEAGGSPGGGGVPTQGGRHPSRCGRFPGEPRCYGSKSILRSNLSSLSSWPQEAQLNHAGTMRGDRGGCGCPPRRALEPAEPAAPARRPPQPPQRPPQPRPSPHVPSLPTRTRAGKGS